MGVCFLLVCVGRSCRVGGAANGDQAVLGCLKQLFFPHCDAQRFRFEERGARVQTSRLKPHKMIHWLSTDFLSL
jgi:ribosomal 50S subunit-associated protein YjgA (DUF615 family)